MDIHDLGELSSPLLCFGGPYGNVQATHELKRICEFEGIPPSRVICTGDLIAYCADPAETVETIRRWGIHCIRGNVDDQLVQKSDHCGCGFREGSVCAALSSNWYPRVARTLDDSHLQYLSALPDGLTFLVQNRRFFVTHGSPQNRSQFVLPSTPWQEKAELLQSVGAQTMVAGHLGIPFIEHGPEGDWINAGVIGMPANDGTPRTWYLIITQDRDSIEAHLKPLEYGFAEASHRMRAGGWSEEYACTLENGLWCSEDILSEAERLKRGEMLSFTRAILTERNK